MHQHGIARLVGGSGDLGEEAAAVLMPAGYVLIVVMPWSARALLSSYSHQDPRVCRLTPVPWQRRGPCETSTLV